MHLFILLGLSCISDGRPVVPLYAKPYPRVPARNLRRPGEPLSFLQETSRASLGRSANRSTLDASTSLNQLAQLWASDVVERHHTMGCDKLSKRITPMSQAMPSFTHISGQTYITELPTYYISLGGKDEQTWLAKFSKLSSKLSVVEGVRGTDVGAVERYLTEPYDDLLTGQLVDKPGVIGCTLSHMRAIKQAFDSGNEVALILESDALPDLAPWWSHSLEEYTNMLPKGWQASQVAWTSEPSQAESKYSIRQQAPFVNSPSYGTVAYLIHRRGMERILSKLWDAAAGKFDIRNFRRDCPHFTSDDCLLSFSPYSPNRGHLLDESQIYEAVPPMFTSATHRGSVQDEDKVWVTASYCDDIDAALTYSALRKPETLLDLSSRQLRA